MTPGFVMGAEPCGASVAAESLGGLLAPAVSLATQVLQYTLLAENWRSTEDKPGYPALARKLVLARRRMQFRRCTRWAGVCQRT